CYLPWSATLRSPPVPYTTLFRSRAWIALLDPGPRQQAARHRLRQPELADLRAAGGPPRPCARPLARGPSPEGRARPARAPVPRTDRKSTRLNSSHVKISYAVFCL